MGPCQVMETESGEKYRSNPNLNFTISNMFFKIKIDLN